MKIAVIGGGAAGFFSALNIKALLPQAYVCIFEKTRKPLAKVEISGGGRCNVTHHLFDPKKLIPFYPRGSKELLGPFHQFQPMDMWKWLETRGVELKVEEDGRVFPASDSSQTIIACFLKELADLGGILKLQERVVKIAKDGQIFIVESEKEGVQTFDYVLLATGSGREGHAFAEAFGHTIIRPVPSLFGFNIKDGYPELSGVSVDKARARISHFKTEGSLLITHFGFTGPAILKLSAFAARYLHDKEYLENLEINWIDASMEEAHERLVTLKENFPKRQVVNSKFEEVPQSLWIKLLEKAKIPEGRQLAYLSKAEMQNFCRVLTADLFAISGKTTNKQEFVTAGGISLSEVDFKTMESKKCKGLYFAGETLDIDGVTGGFNFQSAWTTGWLAALGIARHP